MTLVNEMSSIRNNEREKKSQRYELIGLAAYAVAYAAYA